MKIMKELCIITVAVALVLFAGSLYAQEKLEPVPEIDFLTWVPAKFMAYYETSNYIAEEWKKLGLKVNLNQQNMPNPLLTLWFKEHKFDCVVSVLSGLPIRMEPDFFTYSQFNSKNTAPGTGTWASGPTPSSMTWAPSSWAFTILKSEGPSSTGFRKSFRKNNRTPWCTTKFRTWESTPRTATSTTSRPRTACAPYGTRSGSLQRQREGPQGRKDLGPADVEPVAAIQSDDFEVLRMVYDYLVQIGPKGQVEMWAAEKVETLNDVTIEVTMKKGRKFSDGKPLTAKDVKFTCEYMKQWNAPFFTKYLAPIKTIDLVDEYKLRFNLEKPFAPLS